MQVSPRSNFFPRSTSIRVYEQMCWSVIGNDISHQIEQGRRQSFVTGQKRGELSHCRGCMALIFFWEEKICAEYLRSIWSTHVISISQENQVGFHTASPSHLKVIAGIDLLWFVSAHLCRLHLNLLYLNDSRVRNGTWFYRVDVIVVSGCSRFHFRQFVPAVLWFEI